MPTSGRSDAWPAGATEDELTDIGDEKGEFPGDADQRSRLPPGVEAIQISGPLFFGAANRLDEVFDQFREAPRAFILRMRLVPVVDASGVHAFRALWKRCRARERSPIRKRFSRSLPSVRLQHARSPT